MTAVTDAANRAAPVPVRSFPLTPLQRGMLFHHLASPGSGVDIEQLVCSLPEAVDAMALARAWDTVVTHHDALRTAFRWLESERQCQEVHATVDVPLVMDDRTATLPEDRERVLNEFLRQDRLRGFDLARAPLLRLTLIRWGAEDHQLVWTFHHAILDGRSFTMVVRDAFDAYDDIRRDLVPAFAARASFSAHADWVDQQDWTAASDFWSETLAGLLAATPLPGGPRLVPAYTPARPDDRTVTLSADTTASLMDVAQEAGVTLNTIVQGAWARLLSVHACERDVTFGVVRAGRRGSVADADTMVGLLINTLPLRVDVDPDMQLGPWLRSVRQRWDALRPFEQASLSLVQESSSVPRGSPLFETVLVFEHYALEDLLRQRGGAWLRRGFRLYEQNGYPLTLTASGGSRLTLRLEYDASRYDADAITALLDQLRSLLEAFSGGIGQVLGDLPLLPASARTLIVHEYNATDAAYPDEAVLHQLLADAAARVPDAIAVETATGSMTYRELHARAGTVARALSTRGIGRGALVAVCMDRSLDLLVALLGVLKAGAAYVPMDPGFPAERLAVMLADARCPLVLTDQGIADTSLAALATRAIGSVSPAIVCLDRDWERLLGEAERAGPLPPAAPDDLAYVIFTSGSTGRPKGVEIQHRSLVNLLNSMRKCPGLGASDALLAVTTISFDIAALELFLPLLVGARVVLAPRNAAVDGHALAELIARSGVTVMQATPASWRMLLEGGWTNSGEIRMLCGGEALPAALAVDLVATGGELWNMYGPTETTIWSAVDAVRVVEAESTIPIGRPIDNTSFYVLDARMQPVPIGVAGELHIGGVGVARRYLNRPDLTAERFVPNPFAGDRGGRLYKTGDRARFRPDGRVEFLGRTDHQVKLRGYRIEVGEIESMLREHEAVRDAVVMVREDQPGMRRLVAYVEATAEATAAIHWTTDLRERLPEYMVPSAFVILDTFPHTPNGKVDRNALPAPDRSVAGAEFVAPRDDVESRLLRIWEQVLGVENIGVTRHFNAVGGHSLAAVVVFNRIAKEFGRQIPLSAMLKDDTVEKQANLLRDGRPVDDWTCVVPLTTTGTGVPIFCPHAKTGNILIYQYLAKEMAGSHPFYALQAVGNWGTQAPHESVEEMVEYYVAEVLRVRPRGPYVFFGVSMGGVIALELARAMAARGHEVQHVAMYDTRAPGYPKLTRYGRIVDFVTTHGGIPFNRLQAIFHVDPGCRRSGRIVLHRLRDAARWWIRNTYRDWLCWRFERRNPPRGFPLPVNCTRFWLASRRIEARYRPRVYTGNVTLFRADAQQFGTIPDPTNGWGGLLPNLDTRSVPSGHIAGLQPPMVEGFARVVRQLVQGR